MDECSTRINPEHGVFRRVGFEYSTFVERRIGQAGKLLFQVKNLSKVKARRQRVNLYART